MTTSSFPDSPAGTPSCCDPLLWRVSQLPSLTAFLLLPHPDSLSTMATAHYDIIWLSTISGEVKIDSPPSLCLPSASQKGPISKSSQGPRRPSRPKLLTVVKRNGHPEGSSSEGQFSALPGPPAPGPDPREGAEASVFDAFNIIICVTRYTTKDDGQYCDGNVKKNIIHGSCLPHTFLEIN